MRKLLLAILLVGCGDDLAPDVSGVWRYEWQMDGREGSYDGWDGVFRGELVLEQDGSHVTGTIGYPENDVALAGDPRLKELWAWTVRGEAGEVMVLDAPAPLTAWDDDWRFVLSGRPWSGPGYAGVRFIESGSMVLRR